MSSYNTPTTPHSPMNPKAYAPIAYHCDATSPLLPFYNQQIRKSNFDQFITAEMSRIRTHLAEEETRYIKEKLAENPVELERRTRSPNSSGGESSSRSNSGHPEPTTKISPEHQTLREQRAASCRKSRINNKLKKTTLQYRNEFMSSKVLNLKIELSKLESQMKIAEEKFLVMGHTQAELAQLRTIYGVNENSFEGN
ncbi:protein sisterless A [Eurosta solidaginis]|uniref:protein sisterless A n=1 Tax=Eurosta solidaginis TaxID=178769 RepID=UPI003530BB63